MKLGNLDKTEPTRHRHRIQFWISAEDRKMLQENYCIDGAPLQKWFDGVLLEALKKVKGETDG